MKSRCSLRTAPAPGFLPNRLSLGHTRACPPLLDTGNLVGSSIWVPCPASWSYSLPFPQSTAEIHDHPKLWPSVNQQQRCGDLRLALGMCRGGFYGCGVFYEVGWSLESPPTKVFLFPSSIPCSLIAPPQTPCPPCSLRVGNNTICDFPFRS